MVKRSRNRTKRRDEGQALVEFALIAPIMLMLVMAIIDFGRAWNTYQIIVDSAREGGRVAAVANPVMTIDSVAARMNRLMFAGGLDTAQAVKTVTGFRAGTGTPVNVRIAYPYTLQWLRPFMGWTNAQASFTMNSNVTFRNE